MNGKAMVAIIGVAAVVVGVMAAYNLSGVLGSSQGSQDTVGEEEEVWNTAGNFGVNRHAYKLGEDVFFAGRLAPDQQVLIRVASPEGRVVLERVYNGVDRELVKFYFKPDTNAHKGLYLKDQLVGEWMIWFDGIANDEIYFTMLDEFVPGAEKDIVDLPMPGSGRDAASAGMITVEQP